MQRQAGQQGRIISARRRAAPPGQASLQPRDQQKLVSGDLLGTIQYRLSTYEGMLSAGILERQLGVQVGEVVRIAQRLRLAAGQNEDWR